MSFDKLTLESNIKTPDQMGIGQDLDPNILKNLNNNLSIFNEYNNALIKGSSVVFNNNPNGQPLGERYFMDSGFRCRPVKTTDRQLNPILSPGDPTPPTVARNILIDNMKYLKNGNGAIDVSNTGLLYSAAGSLQDIKFTGLTSNSDNCVEVTINTDANGGTDTKYISVDDYNDLDFTAFPNFCKVYNGNKNCEPKKEFNSSVPLSLTNKLIVGARVNANYMSYGTDYPGTITNVNADGTFKIAYDMDEIEDNVKVSNITIIKPSEDDPDIPEVVPKINLNLNPFQTPSGFPTVSFPKETFQNKNQNLYVESDDENNESYSPTNNEVKYAKFNETIEIHPNIISTYYFTAITVVGLYILYNLLYKKQ